AQRSGVDYLIAESSSFLAVETAKDGNVKGADGSLSLAFAALSRTSEGQRDYVEALLLTRAGEVAQQKGDLPSAIEAYSRAKGTASRTTRHAGLLIDALRGRATAYQELSQPGKARLDLLAAVRTIESTRSMIEDKINRIHYLASTQSVFDQIITLDLSPAVNDSGEAFAMAERSRARALFDEISVKQQNAPPEQFAAKGASVPGRAKPIAIKALQSKLPPSVVLLEYTVAASDTYVFAISKESFKFARAGADASVITTLVNKYVTGIKAKAPMEDLAATARLLHEYLMSPAQDVIADCRYLCIVPDKVLHFLPFAALMDG